MMKKNPNKLFISVQNFSFLKRIDKGQGLQKKCEEHTEINLKEMIKVGVHFGHDTRK